MCHCMPLLPLQPCSLMNLNIHFQRIYAYILTTSFSYPFFAFISNVGLLFLTIMPCPPPSPQIIVGLSVISNNTSNLVWKINLSNCYTWHMPMTYSWQLIEFSDLPNTSPWPNFNGSCISCSTKHNLLICIWQLIELSKLFTPNNLWPKFCNSLDFCPGCTTLDLFLVS